MAADGDRKDPKRPDLNSIWEADEDGWADAIDEWDSMLDLPDLGAKAEDEETAEPAVSATPSGAPGSASLGLSVSGPPQTAADPSAGGGNYRDPLVDFVSTDAEVEIEDGAGEALGSLLGSEKIEDPLTPPVSPAARSGAPDPLDDIGLDPEIVQPVDLEIEMGAQPAAAGDPGWNHELTPVSFKDDSSISVTAELPDADELEDEETQIRPDSSDFEQTQVRADPSDYEETKVRAVPDLEDTQVRGDTSDYEETSIKARIQVPDPAEAPLSKTINPPSTIEALPTIDDSPIDDFAPVPLEDESSEELPSFEPLTGIDEPPDLPTPDLFDELIPPTPDDDLLDAEEIDIQAGDVLPRPEYDEAIPADSVLPVALSEELGEELEIEPPPLPESLTSLDLAALVLTDIEPPTAPPRDDIEQFSEQLQLEANLTDSSTRAAELEYCAASLLAEIGETDEAVEHFREVLNHKPGHVPAMRVLRRAYTARHEPDQVAELIKLMMERVGPDERDALLTTCADLLWSQTGDDSGAQALLEDLGAREPATLRSLLSRADLAAVTGDDVELSTVVQQLADLLQGANLSSSLHLEVGHYKELADKPDEAVVSYQRALAADTRCQSAREGLLRLAALKRDPDMMAKALVDDTRADEASPFNARRLRRRALLKDPAQGVDQGALDDLKRAHEFCPEDLLICEDLAETQRSAGNYQEAIRLYSQIAHQVEDPTIKKLALVEAALIAEHDMDDARSAEDLYREAATLDQDYPPPRLGLARLRVADDTPETRIKDHHAAALATSGPLRAAHHFRAATFWADALSSSEKAVEELLASLEHWPSNRIARLRLEQLYREAGDLEQLAAVFDTAAEATEDAQEAEELRERASLLYGGPLGKPEVALKRYSQILEGDDGRTSARMGKLRSLAALDQQEEYAAELGLLAASIDDKQLSTKLWTACGYHYWAAGRPDEAEGAFRTVIDRSPGELSAAWGLNIQLLSQHRWEESLGCWSALADTLPESSPQRFALWLRMAAIHEKQLQNHEEAANIYRQVAEQPTPARGAMSGLVRILRKSSSEEQRAELLQRMLETARDPAERFTALVSAGELAHQRGARWEESATNFKLALGEIPGHPLARQSLEDLFQGRGELRELSDLLLTDLAEEGDVEHRIAVYHRLAGLDLHRGDGESARHSFSSILDLQPDHLPALRALQGHHQGAGEFGALIERMTQEAEYAASQADRASLWLDLGRRQNHLNQPPGDHNDATAPPNQRGTEAYRRSLESAPSSILALRNLIDLSDAEEDREQLAEFYRALAAEMEKDSEASIFMTRAGELLQEEGFKSFREAIERCPIYLGAIYQLRDLSLNAGDWSSAALAVEAEGQASKVKEHRAFAYLIAGEIAREHLQSPERAITAYQRSLAADPYNWTAFSQLDLFLEEAGRWEELAELLDVRAGVEHSHKKLIHLHHKLALIAKDRLDDSSRAKEHLRLLLSLQGEHQEALTILADLCTADEEWDEAADALMRIARLERDQTALRDLFLRLGHLYQEQKPDHRRAIACLNKVLTLDPDHLEALSRLSTLYTDAQDFSRAVTTTTQLLEREPDEERKIEHLIQIAKIHEDGFKDPHNAALAYRQALEQAPDNLKAISELCGFFARQSDQRSLMIHLDRSVATMRARLVQDPFETFSYRALFKIFRWRKAPDGCLCAAQALEALGQVNDEEQLFLDNHRAAIGSAGSAIGAVEHDDWLFYRSIPSGFRQIFRSLAVPFAKIFPGDIKSHGVTRADRITNADHPCRLIGDALARDFGVEQYQLFILEKNPTALIVEREKSDPPSILLGKALVEGSTEEELLFLMGRSLWTISKGMVLPSRLTPHDLEIFVSGIIRKYSSDFHPPELDLKQLKAITKQVEKAIPRKLSQELMPYAFECIGPQVNLHTIGGAVIHSANRAGLLACRSPYGAMSALRKMAGNIQPQKSPEERVSSLRDNEEAEELLRFVISDAHFELRRGMEISIR